MRTAAYVALAIALCVFGFLGLLSIGAPFLLTGIVMLVFSPRRRQRAMLWPALAFIWAFAITYILLVPSCSSVIFAVPGSQPGPIFRGVTSCSVLGIGFSRGPMYRAPLLPAFLAAIAVGVVVALVAWVVARRSMRTPA